MIRKKTLACSVLLVVVLLTKLYSSSNVSNRVTKEDSVSFTLKIPAEISQILIDRAEEKEKASMLTFADEQIPVSLPGVENKLNTYRKRISYKKLQSYRMHKKAEQHLPKIAKILKSYGIPEDFKYVPLVESELDPKTTSHKGAGGYWQFIPSTARLYGLKVNGDLDERLNLTKSTHAAAKYLKYLYKEFGDWTLVAAAYNVGGGSLKKSIRRQGTENYFKLRLNPETGSYVYKLISMKEVIEDPGRFGFKKLAKADNIADDVDKNIM